MNLGSEDQLVERLFLVNQDEQRYIQAQLKQFNLNVLQARTLNFIDQNPGAHQQDLSEHLGKQNATTTNILKVLEARKLITRRLQPGNERQKQLFLLPDGQEIIVGVRKVFVELEARVESQLTEDEQQLMLGLLTRLHNELGD